MLQPQFTCLHIVLLANRVTTCMLVLLCVQRWSGD